LNDGVRPLIYEITTHQTPDSLAEKLSGERGLVVLRSASFDSPQARYSFVATNPFITFRSHGSRCEIAYPASSIPHHVQFGNPWHLLDSLMAQFEILDEVDLPFPLGGCFGYWGYDLKNFTEPKLPRRAVNDLELPDCHVGFYDSLVVFDHRLEKVWIVSTGLQSDGSRCEKSAVAQLQFWKSLLLSSVAEQRTPNIQHSTSNQWDHSMFDVGCSMLDVTNKARNHIVSNISRAAFLSSVERAQQYIHAGDIYQVNLSHRLSTPCHFSGLQLFERLLDVSPAPFAAYFDCGDFQIASSSPEMFLHLSGPNIQTRPIKGTRPRDKDPTRDAQLAYELQTSPKELAELLMITDLLRNDLGRVCEYGSIQVPELAKLEKFSQVQHLVSTVEGRLRNDVTHFAALASCFPGGSITGAPKFRAMQIIDELEPVSRGPYCGCHGYLGFNRESQLSITIRTAVCKEGLAHFNVGAGIVADSNPEAEYAETLAKAAGFFSALNINSFQKSESATIPQS
jgi:para-aminobenzoate synthetase component 1